MDKDLISVIIPSYNRISYLHRAIDSVLKQTWKNLEIIVVDDFSSQEEYLKLPDIYEHEPRVSIIRLKDNSRNIYKCKSAQGMTRNVGIIFSKGQWIAFLDDDDFYISPDKLEKQVELMTKYNLKASCTNMFTGNGLDNSTYKNVYFNYSIGNPVGNFSADNCSIITGDTIKDTNYINNSTTIIHKSVIEKAGFQKPVKYEDYEYWKECIKYTDFLYLHKCTVGYDMQHGGGIHYSLF